MVQFPKRSNISFAFLGGKRSHPVMRILDLHNCFMSQIIHDSVESSDNKTRLAGQLLCVHDEASRTATKLFQAQLKVAVTGTSAKSMLAGEVSYELPRCTASSC